MKVGAARPQQGRALNCKGPGPHSLEKIIIIAILLHRDQACKSCHKVGIRESSLL